MSANVIVEGRTGFRGANVTVEGSRTQLRGANVVVEQRGLSGATVMVEQRGLSGLGSVESQAAELEAMTRAVNAVSTRKVIAGATGIGGGALLLSGLFSKGALKWPTIVAGVLSAGFGAWLASNIQTEKVLPWEKAVSP